MPFDIAPVAPAITDVPDRTKAEVVARLRAALNQGRQS